MEKDGGKKRVVCTHTSLCGMVGRRESGMVGRVWMTTEIDFKSPLEYFFWASLFGGETIEYKYVHN